MSIHEENFYQEETYNSEDTESTLSGDLDYELSLNVHLPNNTTQKITISASTPWGDLRARLCSQFKLSPSTHVVDFVSSSPSSHKRRTSLAIGKMNITMITIKKKQKIKHVAPPPPAPAFNAEGSVRLIVRLPQSRQSILRVNPDAPLSNVLNSISEKLKLSDESKKQVEFLHPAQHDLKLKTDLSLNYYNIREVFLAEKKAPATPSRGKKKAPPPPRPPLPAIGSRSKSLSSEDQTVPVKEHVEPVYAQIRKPKPFKRRTAPTLPQNAPARSDPNPENSLNVLHNSEKRGKAPIKAPRKNRDLSSVSEENSIIEPRQNDVAPEDHVVSKKVVVSDDESNPYATIHFDVHKKNEDNDNESNAKDALASIEKILDSDEEKDVSKEVEAIHSIDEVLNGFDDGKTQSSADVSDDDVTSESPDFSVPEDNDRNHEAFPEAFDDDSDRPNFHDDDDDDDNKDVIQDDCVAIAPGAPDKMLHVPEEQLNHAQNEDLQLSSRHRLDSDKNVTPLPVVAPLVEKEKAKPEQEVKIQGTKPSAQSQTTSSFSLSKARRDGEDNDNFDLHIAESFNIPLESIDQQHKSIEVKRKEEKNEQVAKPLPFKINGKAQLPAKKGVKPQMTESETEKEIERLQKQIKMMKNRKLVKQKESNSSVNTWQTGSFRFVPTANRRHAHDDYAIAPVGGIQLSTSGEIKPLHGEQQKKVDTPAPQTNEIATLKTKSTLPSYYKKLLGVQAFTASEKK